MTALLAEPAPLLGVQTPRLSWMPVGDWDYTLGDQCVVWARETLRIHLDPWERLVLRMMLARRPDGRWVCAEFALCMPRRNGKSLVLLVRCLFGLFVLGDTATLFTAHLGSTIRSTWQLARRVLDKAGVWYHPYMSDGRERLEFADGQVMWFSTRTKQAGRGQGGDILVVDEAQKADEDEMDALTPILGDRSISGNPQLLYAGSAGNYASRVLARVRRRGLACDSGVLGFAEWSIDDAAYFTADVMERDVMVRAVGSMAQANPSLGITRADGSGGLSEAWLRGQIDVLSPEGFAREHEGIGTWPPDDAADWVIPRAKWLACADETSPPLVGAKVLAIGAGRDNNAVSIAVCGARGDGMTYAEMTRPPFVDSAAAVVAEVKRLRDEHRPAAIVVDDKGPIKFVVPEMDAAGIVLTKVTFQENAQACSGLLAAVTEAEPTFRHRHQPYVTAALAGGRRKAVGDAWLLDRAQSAADVTPLEVLALARWGFVKFGAVAHQSWGFFE